MTRSNRTLNRLLVLGVGLAALAAGAYLAVPALREAAPIGVTTASTWWIVAAVAAAVTALALAWSLTRGRGRTDLLLRAGDVEVDARVAGDVLDDALGREPDVLAVRTAAYRVRGRVALRVRVSTRRGADLASVVRAAGAAVADLDEALETRIPVLLHVASGVRGAVAHSTRAR